MRRSWDEVAGGGVYESRTSSGGRFIALQWGLLDSTKRFRAWGIKNILTTALAEMYLVYRSVKAHK